MKINIFYIKNLLYTIIFFNHFYFNYSIFLLTLILRFKKMTIQWSDIIWLFRVFQPPTVLLTFIPSLVLNVKHDTANVSIVINTSSSSADKPALRSGVETFFKDSHIKPCLHLTNWNAIMNICYNFFEIFINLWKI